MHLGKEKKWLTEEEICELGKEKHEQNEPVRE